MVTAGIRGFITRPGDPPSSRCTKKCAERRDFCAHARQTAGGYARRTKPHTRRRRQRQRRLRDDDEIMVNNNNNNSIAIIIMIIMHRASVLYLNTHTRSFFTGELYACARFDSYLGGGNPGGTGFRDENVGRRDAVACMRLARRRSSRPRRRVRRWYTNNIHRRRRRHWQYIIILSLLCVYARSACVIKKLNCFIL